MTSNTRCMQIVCGSKEGASLQSQGKFVYSQTKKKKKKEEEKEKDEGEEEREKNVSKIPDL